MFSFGLRRQNTGSPRANASPGSPGSPRVEVGEIDTRAPFQSVKAAVSMFAEGASPKARPLLVKKPKTAEERVLEKETHLHLTLKELEKFKELLKSAETTRAQGLRELEKANRTLQELTGKLETVSESKQVAIASTEAAKKRAKQLEDAKSSQQHSHEIGGGSGGVEAWRKDVDSEREQYKASAAELIVAKQELTNIRQDFDAALEAKLNAFQKAADAQHAAKVNRERLAELSQEVTKMRETLAQVKLASSQAQEERNRITAEKETRLLSDRESKEAIEKKILYLKEESDPELANYLEEKLEETTEAAVLLQEQLNNVQAMDLESLKTATMELDDAKKALQEILEEESSYRGLIDPLKQELDTVTRDRPELREKEAEMESVAKNLRAKLEITKAELEAAIAQEAKEREASNKILIQLQHLSAETEMALREAEEMSRNVEQLKKEAETSWSIAKEAEEKLEVALREAEEAKAAEKIADDKIHNTSAETDADDSKNSEFNNMINLSTEEFESLSGKVEEAGNFAERETAAALAQVEEIHKSEREAAKRLEESLKEIEDLKTETEEALKRAEMAEAAKQMVEAELEKWRQEEDKPTDGEISYKHEPAGISLLLQ